METRAGVQGTVHHDVFFTEAAIPDVPVLRHVRVQISRQNSNLNEVKEKLARKAKSCGATAIMNFRYGQKGHAWWQFLLMMWDTECWRGEGDAIKL